MSLELFSAEQQRRILLQVLIDLEPLPKCTRVTIEEPESSICVLVVTFTRSRVKLEPVRTAHPEEPIQLSEQVRIADYWHPQHIRESVREAVDTLRRRSGWA